MRRPSNRSEAEKRSAARAHYAEKQRQAWHANRANNVHVANGIYGARVFPDHYPNHCRSFDENALVQVSEREPDECFNAANASSYCCLGGCAHGSCQRGVCICEAGWRGVDCAEDIQSSSGDGAADDGFIYVHSPPHALGLQNLRKFQCHKNSYDADYHLLRRLLLDPAARTKSLSAPSSKLFYVPTWAASSWGNAAGHQYGISIEKLVAWLRSTAEFRAHWAAHRQQYLCMRARAAIPSFPTLLPLLP